VEPVRRATGSARPLAPSARAIASRPDLRFDEVYLMDGSRMQGRVDIVRAGAIVFLDMRTGLRHELRKEAIDHIVTEFGNTVQFRPSRHVGLGLGIRVSRAGTTFWGDPITARPRGQRAISHSLRRRRRDGLGHLQGDLVEDAADLGLGDGTPCTGRRHVDDRLRGGRPLRHGH
jgi:hypothetical protein